MNDLQHDIDATTRRTWHYWFEDGLAEISGGAVFVLVGLYFLAERVLDAWLGGRPPARAAGIALNVVFPVLIVLLAFAGRRLMRTAKDRYVHPRTGYIAFRRPTWRHRWATGALAGVISMLMALFLSRAPAVRNWVLALEGLVFAIAFFYLSRKAQTARFAVEGLVCAFGGVGLSLLRLDERLSAASLFGGCGLLFIASGVLAFAAYLRHAPPPEQP